MALETFPYDSADYLTSPEAISTRLAIELEMNEPTYWPAVIAAVGRARGGLAGVAAETNITLSTLEAAAETPDRDVMLQLKGAYDLNSIKPSLVA